MRKSIIFLILIFAYVSIASAATTLKDNSNYDYAAKIKFLLSPTDCWTSGAGGCAYIHRADGTFVGLGFSYSYSNMGVIIPIESNWESITSFRLLTHVINASYPLNVRLYTMNTNDPNNAKTLVQQWNILTVPPGGQNAISYFNLNYDLIVTDGMGNKIYNYLFIEIRNPPSADSCTPCPLLGFTQVSTSGSSNVWLDNDFFSAGTYSAGTYIQGSTQSYSGNMIYPAFTDFYGNSFSANPTDNRQWIGSPYYTIYGNFRFPQTPSPTPTGTGTPGGTPIPPPGNPPPDATPNVVMPDFSNPTAYCPNCQGNETRGDAPGTLPNGTGIGQTMKGLGYCGSGSCTIDDFINLFYDMSSFAFLMSLMYVIVKMGYGKRRQCEQYPQYRRY